MAVLPARAARPSSSRITDPSVCRSCRTGSLARMQDTGCDPDRTTERVEFRVWAPDAGAVAVRVGGARARSSSAPTTGPGPATCPRGPATTTSSSSTAPRGPIRARASSRRACAGRRASSTRARFEIAPGPQLALDELVIYELHVGTFSRRGHVRRRRSRTCAELRELGVTAIELMPVATFPGQPRLGLRRPLHLRAASGLRRAGRARAPRRRRAPRGPRRDPRRRLQPHRPGLGGDRRLRPVLHRPRTRRSGATRSTTAQRGVREWAIQNARAVDARLPDRRPAPRRRARDLRRLAAARPRRARKQRVGRRSSSPR